MSLQPAYCRPLAYRTLAEHRNRLDTGRELFRAAWALALHEHPDADLAAGETVVENLATAVNRRVRSRDPEARLAHLHDVLFEVFGLSGNVEDYYNSANCYLPEVLRTRLGIPISLALVYRCVAEETGLTVHGINAPGHFLVEVEVGSQAGGRQLVDPFYGGEILTAKEVADRILSSTGRMSDTRPELLVRTTGRQWLQRILNNLQAIFATANRERDLYAMQELQTLLGR